MLKIYNKKEFINRICNTDEIILFGAGQKLKDLEIFFQDTNIQSKITMLIDNAIEKQGKIIELWGENYEVVSLHQLIENQNSNKVILITLEDYGVLLDDLLADDRIRGTEIVCFSHIAALHKESKSIDKIMPSQMRLEVDQVIPKMIHYCWFGGKTIPEKFKSYIESWHKFCPGYEIIEWNEFNYDISKCKYMQEAYEKRIWGFVPDYARLDIVYNYGGIYLDVDVELVRNIDDLLYQKGFAAFEDEIYVNLGSGFGAMKGLPILKVMMESYNKKKFIYEDDSLNLVGSPVYNTSILRNYGLISNGDYQRVADMTIYPAKVLNGKYWHTMRTVIKPWTYAIHHYDGSWITERERRIKTRLEQDMMEYPCEEVL